MYLGHTRGCNLCASRKAVSNLSMKRHKYDSANLVPMAMPKTCCLTVKLKEIVL